MSVNQHVISTAQNYVNGSLEDNRKMLEGRAL